MKTGISRDNVLFPQYLMSVDKIVEGFYIGIYLVYMPFKVVVINENNINFLILLLFSLGLII